MPAGTHGVARPRPLFIPSNDPDVENLEYSRLSVQPAAVSGTSSLPQNTIAVLTCVSFEKLGELNSALCRLDQVRAGIVRSRAFRNTLRKEDLGLNEEGIENVVKAYSLDRHHSRVWWSRFIHDMSQLAGHPTRSSGPTALMDPPSSPEASLDFSFSQSPEASRLPETDSENASEESTAIIKDIATFCLERRINVEGAFADFQRPGKFCKRVKRVTRCQFREVLNFILNGIYHVTDRQFEVLAKHFDDGSGFVLYGDFVRAVDPYLEPGTGFTVLQMNSPNSGRRSTSPRRSISSLADSLSPGSPSSQLLGVQPMGPPECQVPGRIEVFERLRVDDIMAKIRHLCKIYSIIMVDQLRENDRHQEGSIPSEKFCRAMDVLRVLRLQQAEVEVLLRRYKAEVPGASHEPRFNYRQFCEDLQPTGPEFNAKMATLRTMEHVTSPFAVVELTEDEALRLQVVHKRFGAAIQSRRIGFRSFFSDFDRATKTRTGSTYFNYTLNAGCISRSQFLQALRSLGLSDLLSTEDLELLFKRYERAGEFNHLVFLRDLEEAERVVEAEILSPARDKSPQNSFEMSNGSQQGSLNTSAASR